MNRTITFISRAAMTFSRATSRSEEPMRASLFSRLLGALTLALMVLTMTTALATTKTVTYTITSTEESGSIGNPTYTIVFTRSGDIFDTSPSAPNTYTVTVSKSSFANLITGGNFSIELADGFKMEVSWPADSKVEFLQNCIYPKASGKNITYKVSCTNDNYYVTHVTMKGTGDPWLDTDYDNLWQFAQEFGTAQDFGTLTITYADTPSLTIFESDGTKAYKIKDKADLFHLANYVNKGKDPCTGLTFRQTQEITCDNTYTPIGYYLSASDNVPFSGTYDGNGKTISGITVERTGKGNANSYVGLFDYVDEGKVKNVVLASSTFTGLNNVGGIVGSILSGTVENCRVESTVTINAGTDYAEYHGGIAGIIGSDAKVIGCTSAATISKNSWESHSMVGGIVGSIFSGTVKDCLYIGTDVEGISNGAIVGDNHDGTLSNNYYTTIDLGGVNYSDQDGARRARTVTLGEDIALVGDETTYSVSGITAIGTTALRYNDGSTTTLYSGATQTLTLSHSYRDGYAFSGYTTTGGGTVSGSTLTMPAADVTVSATWTVTSGNCGRTDANGGKNVKWQYTESTGTLRIYPNITDPSGTDFSMKLYNMESDVPWYDYRANITTLIVEDGVQSIGDYAMYGCTALTSANITIPASVTRIGSYAFRGCTSLTTAPIGSGVTEISSYAFWKCTGITSVTIPASVTDIGLRVFDGCTSLTGITVAADNPNYKDIEGVLTNKDGTTLIRYPQGKTASYTIPDGVTTIGNAAFYGCTGLTSVTIPQGITTIGGSAFYECTGLTSVTIPQGVTTIGDSAFDYCASLATIILNSNPFIEETAFPSGATVTMNLTANAAGGARWMTFYNKLYNFKADDDTQVFKAERSGTTVILHEVTDGIVDANTGVVLKTTGSNPVMTLTTESSTNTDDNSLTGVSEPDGKYNDGKLYVLNYTTEKGLGFYHLATSKTTFEYGKAYLTYSGALAPEFLFFEEDSADGISLTPALSKGEGDWYTIDGRKLDKQPTTKGLYINGGKVVVVK